MLYLIALLLGVIIFVRLYLSTLELLPLPQPLQQCTLLSEPLCQEFAKAPFLGILTAWAALQLTWVSMLLAVHLLQIARATTTFEAMRGHNVSPLTAAIATGSTDTGLATAQPGTAGIGDPGSSASRSGKQKNKKNQGWWQTAKRLLGLDTVFATALYGSRAEERLAAQRRNPYNRGCVGNCVDFWADDRGGGSCVKGLVAREGQGRGVLGGQVVDYRRLYSVPASMRYRGAGEEGIGLASAVDGGEEV